MKNLLFLLLFAATSAGAQVVLTTRGATAEPFYGLPGTVMFTNESGAIEGHLTLQKTFDCESYETLTPWLAKSEGDDGKFIHKHEWVYAEHDDINKSYGLTAAVYCPCGCPTTENQARICEACFRHECRTREYGQRPKEKEKSKYLQILESKN